MLSQQLLHEQVREKTDKFQQRRLDGFFKAGAKAADESNAAEEAEPPAMPEVMAMEVEMEVSTHKVQFHCRPGVPSMQTQQPSNIDPLCLSIQTQCSFHCRLSVPFSANSMSPQCRPSVPVNAKPVSSHRNASVPFNAMPVMQTQYLSSADPVFLSVQSQCPFHHLFSIPLCAAPTFLCMHLAQPEHEKRHYYHVILRFIP